MYILEERVNLVMGKYNWYCICLWCRRRWSQAARRPILWRCVYIFAHKTYVVNVYIERASALCCRDLYIYIDFFSWFATPKIESSCTKTNSMKVRFYIHKYIYVHICIYIWRVHAFDVYIERASAFLRCKLYMYVFFTFVPPRAESSCTNTNSMKVRLYVHKYEYIYICIYVWRVHVFDVYIERASAFLRCKLYIYGFCFWWHRGKGQALHRPISWRCACMCIYIYINQCMYLMYI